MNGPTNPNSTISTKITRPAIPTLLCRKRRMICCRWLRALTPNSRSTPPLPCGVPGTAGSTPPVLSGVAWVVAMNSFFLESYGSGEPDPRVEDRVEEVGDQVEQDDEGRADHQPAEHHVRVVVLDAVLDQVLAHPVPDEDGLGDDRAA